MKGKGTASIGKEDMRTEGRGKKERKKGHRRGQVARKRGGEEEKLGHMGKKKL